MSPKLQSTTRAALAALVPLGALLAAATAFAAQPSPVIPVQGMLRAVGGGPVADGDYTLTLRIYPVADAELPVYKEVHVAVLVSQGGFFTWLGGQDPLSPIPPTLFADHPAAWLGVQVKNDPELPRSRFETLPYAIHAQVADSLVGPLDGALVLAQSLPASALAFPYAGSATAAGPAADLACTGCIGLDELDAGVLDAKHVVFQHGGQVSTVQTALGALVAALHVNGSSVGVGKSPADLCVLDIGSDGGTSCVDGAPALFTRVASSEAAMFKLGPDGLIAYRKDEERAYIRMAGKWRRLLVESVCGDGIVDLPEQCDDGDANADAPDKCRKDCTKPGCGDQIVDTGELCDDGNSKSDDACIACKVATCGDGFVEAGVEACDDGDADNTNACTNACKVAACGDGFTQAGVEACDDGDANADAPDKCRKNCSKPACGDGITDGGEQCDDGNKNDSDTCTNACKAACTQKCANGSCTDCNKAGQTLIGSSAFVDPSPPAGWTQCFGFVNTGGNDVGNAAADNCLGASKIRYRIFDDKGAVVVDVYSDSTQNMQNSWPGSGKYISGSIVFAKCGPPWWPCGEKAGLYGSTNGTCSGGWSGFPGGGMCFSNGNCEPIAIALGGASGNELLTAGCSAKKQDWIGYKAAIYR